MTGEIDQDIDFILGDYPRRCFRRKLGDDTPVIDHGLQPGGDPIRLIPGIVAIHLETAAVVMVQHRLQKIADGVVAQVG